MTQKEYISKETVEDILNDFFEHDLIYRKIIQIFPNATYFPKGMSGKKVLQLYNDLGLDNKVKNRIKECVFKYLMDCNICAFKLRCDKAGMYDHIICDICGESKDGMTTSIRGITCMDCEKE